jgi:HSP20 family protein
MANNPRSNPFGELLHELSEGFFVKPFARAAGVDPAMKLDVKEDDNAYTIRAEIPGARKEDIHVDVEGNGVTLRAEIRQEKEQKENEKVIYSERSYGMLSRSFSLPGEVDAQRAKAEYRDGVLNLTLPKKLGGQTRRVSIS